MSDRTETSLAHRIAERMAQYTIDRNGGLALENAKINQADAQAGNSILALRDTVHAKTDSALIIAAGPSIHKYDTASRIKSSGFHGTIIATESAMAWCLRNEIVPHVVVTADPHPNRIVRWFGDPNLDEAMLASDDYFERQEMDPSFRFNQLKTNLDLVKIVDRFGPEMSICVASSASASVVARCKQARMPMYWWNPMFDDYDAPGSLSRKIWDLNQRPCINAGGNVGAACWVIAHAVLNKTKIGILGMDLSYYGDTPYRETQYYPELCELVGSENIARAFVNIQNPFTGTAFYTDPAYLWYRDVFLEMASQAQEQGVETYNCTGGGILFDPPVRFTDLESFAQAVMG